MRRPILRRALLLAMAGFLALVALSVASQIGVNPFAVAAFTLLGATAAMVLVELASTMFAAGHVARRAARAALIGLAVLPPIIALGAIAAGATTLEERQRPEALTVTILWFLLATAFTTAVFDLVDHDEEETPPTPLAPRNGHRAVPTSDKTVRHT